jgi:hypothetical protein
MTITGLKGVAIEGTRFEGFVRFPLEIVDVVVFPQELNILSQIRSNLVSKLQLPKDGLETTPASELAHIQFENIPRWRLEQEESQ